MTINPNDDLVSSEINEYAATTGDDVMDDSLSIMMLAKLQNGGFRSGSPFISEALALLKEKVDRNPIACFALAEILGTMQDPDDGGLYAKTDQAELYERVVELGLPRLARPEAPYDESPANEAMIREIIGMALTNIGARLANGGRQADAVDYFRRALLIFPNIPNTHVCLGNMAIYYPDMTKLNASDGFAAWKRAEELEEERPHCRMPDSRFRNSIVANCEKIAEQYGRSEMANWLRRVGVLVQDGEPWHCVPVFKHLGDLDIDLPPDVVEVERFFELLRPMLANQPLEVKVTVSASILANACVINGEDAIDYSLLDDVLETCSVAEPLKPLIGDDEWQELHPPTTSYLQEEEFQRELFNKIRIAASTFRAEHRQVGTRAAITGLLFKFDRRFRDGLASMLRSGYGDSKGLTFGRMYTPALHIGSWAGMREHSAT